MNAPVQADRAAVERGIAGNRRLHRIIADTD
jgi:hypothetical protein